MRFIQFFRDHILSMPSLKNFSGNVYSEVDARRVIG